MVNKRAALFFVVINTAYLGYSLILFFFATNHSSFHSSHILGQVSNKLDIPAQIAALSILYGLFWAIRTLKEKRFIRAGFLVYFFWQTGLTFLLRNLLYMVELSSYHFIGNTIYYTNSLLLIYLFVTALFIKKRFIKKYVIIFTYILFISFIGPGLVRYRFNFDFPWLVNSKRLLLTLAYLASFLLFIQLYKIAPVHQKRVVIAETV